MAESLPVFALLFEFFFSLFPWGNIRSRSRSEHSLLSPAAQGGKKRSEREWLQDVCGGRLNKAKYNGAAQPF